MRDFVDLLFSVEQSRWTWRALALVGAVVFSAGGNEHLSQHRHALANVGMVFMMVAVFVGRKES